jgi:hypothetical protein
MSTVHSPTVCHTAAIVGRRYPSRPYPPRPLGLRPGPGLRFCLWFTAHSSSFVRTYNSNFRARSPPTIFAYVLIAHFHQHGKPYGHEHPQNHPDLLPLGPNEAPRRQVLSRPKGLSFRRRKVRSCRFGTATDQESRVRNHKEERGGCFRSHAPEQSLQ